MALLFQPIQVGDMLLQHRIALAPLTRFRADSDHVHHDVATRYYQQRSQEAGTLVISEGTFIDKSAGGTDYVPGIYTAEQIAAWKQVVDAVHANGSYIFLQLWSIGRAAKAAVLEREGHKVIAPSSVPLAEGDLPSAMTAEEIQHMVSCYASAARNFVEGAGGDGVEIHGAIGYLVDQFLQTTSNHRQDTYGGSVENRMRFGLEVLAAVTGAVGARRTAIRISPYSPFQGMRMVHKDLVETFSAFVTAIRAAHPDLAYLHVVQARISGSLDVAGAGSDQSFTESTDFINKIWAPAPLLVAGGLNRQSALAQTNAWPNSVAVFGRYFISNPDLVARLKKDLALKEYDRATFYLQGPTQVTGYVDYPNFSGEVPFAPLL